jgi:hypothetical protein
LDIYLLAKNIQSNKKLQEFVEQTLPPLLILSHIPYSASFPTTPALLYQTPFLMG